MTGPTKGLLIQDPPFWSVRTWHESLSSSSMTPLDVIDDSKTNTPSLFFCSAISN